MQPGTSAATVRAEGASGITGTKLQIVEAALETLKTTGFAGASARAIARQGDFNQALIFYHFGSVRNLLLAVLDLISERRMQEYGPAFERARSAPELMELARTIYANDLERGYITVLGEMVSGGVSDADLGAEVAARIEPWIEMVERKLRAAAGRDGPAGIGLSSRRGLWARRSVLRSRHAQSSAGRSLARRVATGPRHAPVGARRGVLAFPRSGDPMSNDTSLDLVTGAFSYSGSHIAKRLLDGGAR